MKNIGLTKREKIKEKNIYSQYNIQIVSRFNDHQAIIYN